MKPLKTLLSLALCAALTLGLAPAARAASSVRVKLPAFPVTLGAQTVDPANEEYPFLVYKDVTYLPLTYYGCRLLGLYAKWSPESGLTISDAGAKGAYQPTPRVSRNGGALYAQIAAGKITICNKTIDNNSEEYPFLLFRDVTYLPMTWANLHDLLGCVYTFDGARGLTIDRAADGSASVLDLPRYNGEGSVAAWQGWFWYQDADGWISRAPMAGGASEKLFELPINVMYTDAPAWASLTVSDGKLYMTYHLGGATMGHDESYRFHADGTYVTLVKRNGPVGEFDGVWLHANGSLMPSPGNLRVSYDEGATWEQFGSEHHVYGWSYHGSKGGGASASYTASGIYKADGYAYLLATDAANWGSVQPDANGDYPEQFSAVCRVDLESGETTEIAPNAAAFRLAGGAVWYATFDGELRRCALDGSGDELALRPKDGWKLKTFLADESFVYAVLTDELLVGTDGVEPHFATEVYLAVLPVDGGEAELSLLGGSVESMQLDGGYLTLLTRDDLTDVMSLRVLRGGEVVYERRGPDFVAAGVSDGKLYYVLK